ncbi:MULTISPECIES: hypothetical protein [unclassified Nocardia]|uniref:hypothetical protein n=1 Tax=unclassified Nocardia TaxID=2637762 RepID=UPI0033BB246E
MRSRRSRLLLAGDKTYRWTLSHRHEVTGEASYRDCREILTVRSEGSRTQLRIVFADGPNRLVAGTYLHSGGVLRLDDNAYLNLHRPGVVRTLIDLALTGGADVGRTTELDGWQLFDQALRDRGERTGVRDEPGGRG